MNLLSPNWITTTKQSMTKQSAYFMGKTICKHICSCGMLTRWGRDKKFVPKGPINNIPASVQIMAWRRPGDKPLSEPMMVGLTTHICVTRPQWVNWGPFYKHELTLIPAWISNHMANKVWNKITFPFTIFNDCIIENWVWISNFIPHFIVDVITYHHIMWYARF